MGSQRKIMSKSPKIKIVDITADDETVIKNDEVLANETNDEIVCISSDIKEKVCVLSPIEQTVVNELKKQ